MEFGLTRNTHRKNPDDPFTITGLFKRQRDGAALLEALRILREALEGEELLPVWVGDWHEYIRQTF